MNKLKFFPHSVGVRSRKGNFFGEFRRSNQTAARLHSRHSAFVPHLSVITKTICGAEAPAALSRCQQVSEGMQHAHF